MPQPFKASHMVILCNYLNDPAVGYRNPHIAGESAEDKRGLGLPKAIQRVLDRGNIGAGNFAIHSLKVQSYTHLPGNKSH